MQYVDFTIIIDTREQHPWELKHYSKASRKLDTGDYSVEGLENLLCIERKYSISEFVNNMGEKRFKDVLERMKAYQYAFIIMEFNFSDILNFPVGSTIPKKVWDKLKISPSYIIKYITDIQMKYGIHILFCDSVVGAEKMALSIMRRVVENHADRT
jgi:ERCC4-type nuclease